MASGFAVMATGRPGPLRQSDAGQVRGRGGGWGCRDVLHSRQADCSRPNNPASAMAADLPYAATNSASGDHHPWEDWVTEEPPHYEDGIPAEVVRHMIGLGTWRLNGLIQEPYEAFTIEVEGIWRQMLEGKLGPGKVDPDLRFIDSGCTSNAADLWETIDVPMPDATDPEYPRLFAESRVYSTEQLRKMHILLVHRQDGLQLLQCLMVPKTEYDLPILFVEMMGTNGVSVAASDLVPANNQRELSPFFSEGVRLLQEESVQPGEELPRWARGTSSDMCVGMRPQSDEDLSRFLAYSCLLAKLYLRSSKVAEKAPEEMQPGIKAAHRRFFDSQRRHAELGTVLREKIGNKRTAQFLNDFMFQYD